MTLAPRYKGLGTAFSETGDYSLQDAMNQIQLIPFGKTLCWVGKLRCGFSVHSVRAIVTSFGYLIS